jgi:hypothetical protein
MFIACYSISTNPLYVYYHLASRLYLFVEGGYTEMSITLYPPKYYPLDHISVVILQ